MAAQDFFTNIETAFLALFASNAVLQSYHWQRWDSDAHVKLPRGIYRIAGKRDPEGSPIFRLEIDIMLEGKPKAQKQSVAMNELKMLLENTGVADLEALAPGLVHFYNQAESVEIRQTVQAGLRIWGISFVIYAVPMV